MLILPAIDLIGGKCVRLTRGHYDRKTEYSINPVDVAREFKGDGATHLHVVDLDGARTGAQVNLEVVRQIKAATGLHVEYGGGVRTVANIEAALAAGVDRVMVGTAAFTDDAFLAEAVKRWPDRLLVAVDIRGGKVAVRGWHATLDVTLRDAIAMLHGKGVRGVVYTDTERDGTLEGADTGRLTAATEACRELGVFLHFAGGVRDVEDIRRLKAFDANVLRGVITGKAVYEGTLDLAEAIRLAGGKA